MVLFCSGSVSEIEFDSLVVCCQHLQALKPSLTGKRPQPKVSIKIKSQPKKARLESSPASAPEQNVPAVEKVGDSNCLGLVAYSDESDDE